MSVDMVGVVVVRSGDLPPGAAEVIAECSGHAILIDVEPADDIDPGGDDSASAGVGTAKGSNGRVGIGTEAGDIGFQPERLSRFLAHDRRVREAEVIVMPASADGRALAPRLAALLDRPLLAGALKTAPGVATVSRWGGRRLETLAVDGPYVATLEPGVRGVPANLVVPSAVTLPPLSTPIQPPSNDPAASDTVGQDLVVNGGVAQDAISQDVVVNESVAKDAMGQKPVVSSGVAQDAIGQDVLLSGGVAQDAIGRKPVVSEVVVNDAVALKAFRGDAEQLDLADAPAILTVGAGLGDKRLIDLAAAVAAKLGLALGATRVVTDRGWLPVERQIGTTGVTVAPDVYVALAVSGAVQHVAGLGDPAHLVSVNLDGSCPMSSMAEINIIADAPSVLVALADRIGVDVDHQTRRLADV